MERTKKRGDPKIYFLIKNKEGASKGGLIPVKWLVLLYAGRAEILLYIDE